MKFPTGTGSLGPSRRQPASEYLGLALLLVRVPVCASV